MKNSNFYCFNKRELIAILTEKFPKITFYEFSIFWVKIVSNQYQTVIMAWSGSLAA